MSEAGNPTPTALSSLPTPPAPTPTPQAAWYDGADAETVGYFQNRGWDKLEPGKAAIEAAKAHRNAEKIIGVPADQLIKLPKEPGDVEGWNKVYERLGRPAQSKDYDFKDVKFGNGDELDDATADWLRARAFRNNLSKEQAVADAKEFVAKMDSIDSAENAAKQAKTQAELAALKKSWGANFDANNFVATQAAQKLGLDAAMLKAMSDQVGPSKVMEVMLGVGVKLGEDKYIAGGAGGPGVISREQAKAKLAENKANRDWSARLFKNGKDGPEMKELEALSAIAAGGP